MLSQLLITALDLGQHVVERPHEDAGLVPAVPGRPDGPDGIVALDGDGPGDRGETEQRGRQRALER